MHTVNLRITHKKADVRTLEAVSFDNVSEALKDIYALPSIDGCIILQTCNRLEIFASSKDVNESHHDLLDYIMGETISKFKRHFKNGGSTMPREKILEHMINASKQFHDVIEVEYHTNALLHLLRLSCGLESMIIGEDQILGQLRESKRLASEEGTLNPFLNNILSKAIHVGKRARSETGINIGAVSIGSAAVDLATSVLGDLSDKKVLLLGAGDMGKLISKSLLEMKIKDIVIANRTMENGKALAEMLKGRAVPFRSMLEEIRDSDLVITATGAPEPILKASELENTLKDRPAEHKLVIIDVANPRDVEQGVSKIKGVSLHNIDSLRSVAEKNLKNRLKEVYTVEDIIEEEIGLLEKKLYHVNVDNIVNSVFKNAEAVRRREVEKAITMLGNGIKEKDKEVINNLTKVIIKKTMTPIAGKIRKVAELNDEEALRAAEIYFTGR